MPKFELIALELLEYKVADLKAQRRIDGGPAAAWDLYKDLAGRADALSPSERERFEQASRTLRLFAEVPKVTRNVTTTFDNLVLGAADEPMLAIDNRSEPELASADDYVESAPEVRDEKAVLMRLARRAWWDQLDDFVINVAAGWRAERERYTARLLYATLRNLSRYGARSTFAQDVNLRHLTVEESIPERTDPLVSLNDLDSLAEIVREVVNLVTTLGKPNGPYNHLEIDEIEALGYVKRAAMAVAQNPYGGRLSLLDRHGPTSKQIRLAIQELAKERLPEDQRSYQRRELEHRLSETLAHERNQRQLFQRDVLRFADLVQAFFERLGSYLPTNVGGTAGGPQLQGGVLFGSNPALRWESVPSGAEAITVRLLGPVRFLLDDIEVAVMGSEGARMLFVDDSEYPLQPRMLIEVGSRKLVAYYEAGYLHLRITHEGRTLATAVAEALTVFFVLSSDQREEVLTVLKIVANSLQGEPQDLVALAIGRAAEVSAKAPNRRGAIEGLLRGAARAAGVVLEENLILGLVQRFHAVMTVGPTDLASLLEQHGDAEATVYQLTGEPLNIDAAGLKLTVRLYRGREGDASGSLVVMLPGQVLGSFSDYLIEPINGGTLMCVRGEQEVAILFIAGVPVESSRAL
jgi:hypothetical protein